MESFLKVLGAELLLEHLEYTRCVSLTQETVVILAVSHDACELDNSKSSTRKK